MTTVADIRAGNYCPDCAIDCRNFVPEGDCCIYCTTISRIYSETIKDESDLVVHYDPITPVILTDTEKHILFNNWMCDDMKVIGE